MRFASVIIGLAALASLSVGATEQTLPWDGRGQDLLVETSSSRILSGYENPTSYVNVTQNVRSPAYNSGTSAITLGVDAKAIYQGEVNVRRTDLTQSVVANTEGTTFFRASVMKEKAFLNPYTWHVIFPGSHLFEIRVDATANPPMIIYVNNGTSDSKWNAEYVPSTWYNFGVGVTKSQSGSSTVLDFYTSQGGNDLVLEDTYEIEIYLPASYEYHIGLLLTQTTDDSEPAMNAEMDTLSFNGVSIEAIRLTM